MINFGLKAKFRRINFRSKFRPNFVVPKLFVINVLKNSQNTIFKWSLILINTSFEDKVSADAFVWKDVEYLSYKGIRGLITNWKEVMIHTWKFTLVLSPTSFDKYNRILKLIREELALLNYSLNESITLLISFLLCFQVKLPLDSFHKSSSVE